MQKKRYEIVKARRNFRIEKVGPTAYIDEMFAVLEAAHAAYPAKYRPQTTYESLVASAFENNPKADVLIFNFINESQGRRVNGKTKRIRYHNYMNYGAARIAFRRRPIVYHSIFFNTMFGGGTPHQCGEDTLFLNSCLKAGLKVYAVPVALA